MVPNSKVFPLKLSWGQTPLKLILKKGIISTPES